MNLSEARELLGLGLTATRREIRAAYRRAARRWHPDLAPPGEEARYRAAMQAINLAYQRLSAFLEDYRYRLTEAEGGHEDLEGWWHSRFNVGVWAAPPRDTDKES